MNTNEIKESSNFIDEKILNLARIRNQRTEFRNKENLQIFNEETNKYKEIYVKKTLPEKLVELFNEDSVFEDCYYKTSLFWEINEDKLNLKRVFEKLKNIGIRREFQHQQEVKNNKDINYSCAHLMDYLYNCIILKISSTQYENYNFVEFENKYKEVVDFDYNNPLFRDIICTFLSFIRTYIIEKKRNLPSSFKKNMLEDNIKIFQDFNEKFNNSIPSSAKDFIYKDLSDYSEEFFKSLDIDKNEFNKTMEEYYDNISLNLLNTFSDNYLSEDENTSTAFKKKVSAIASTNTHYLDFIDYLLINKNEKNFPLVKNAINHGIFVSSLLDLSSSKKNIEKKSLSEDEEYVRILIIELKKDYHKSFNSLIFLFIANYLGIPKTKSYKFANLFSSKTINKKTYSSYTLKLENHIIRIKHYFFDNKKCPDLCKKYDISC